MLVEVGEGNMTVLVDEVGQVESGESGDGEMREGGEGGGDMGQESEACQLALDITQQLLVSMAYM